MRASTVGTSTTSAPRNAQLFCARCSTAFTWREGRIDVRDNVFDLVLCPNCHADYDTKWTPQGMTLTSSNLRFRKHLQGTRVVQRNGSYGLEAYGQMSAITSVRDPENIFETTAETISYPISEQLLPAGYDCIERIWLHGDDYREFYRIVLLGKVGLQLVRFDDRHEHAHTATLVPATYDRLAAIDLRGPVLFFFRAGRFDVFERRYTNSDAVTHVAAAHSWDRLVAKLTKIRARHKLPALSDEQLRVVRDDLGAASKNATR
jgi:hypothetical protein